MRVCRIRPAYDDTVILLVAVVAGLFAGSVRAFLGHRYLAVPPIDRWWLALVAFAVQYVVFLLPATRAALPQSWAAAGLVTSQVLLLLFIWSNRQFVPFWLMGAGLLMNLAAIGLNGGLMPISPETLERLYPDTLSGQWHIGERVGMSKNVLLPASSTTFEVLADRFFLPTWSSYSVAYSLGDVFIAAGVFLFLWQAGAPQHSSRT